LRIFENRLLEEDNWIYQGGSDRRLERLHNQDHSNLYHSPDIIRVIKRRRMKWMRHKRRMREMRNACRILISKLRRKGPLRHLCVYRRSLLKYILK